MIRTIAGNGERGFSGDGGLAANAELDCPYMIAISPNGEIYIADTYNNRIREVAPNGSISTIAGNGSDGFSGDGGLATNVQLCEPCGIAVSENGEIYIADTHNHRIYKITKNGFISTIAGNGEMGSSGDGGLATNARLCDPHGLAVSSSGEIYIADMVNHTIRKISKNGFISTIAGNGKGGFSGDGGLATNARLYYPQGIALSESGEVYIADRGNHRIRKISKNGFISTIAGNGEKGFSGDGGLATNAQLFHPQGIAVSSNGKVYIADRGNHRIRTIALDGLISTIAGNGKKGFNGDDSSATNAELNFPRGIALGSNGELYIADTNNDRIRKIDALCLDDPIMSASLKKYERDHTLGGLVCFLPLLAKLAPNFYETILNTDTLLSFDANEKHIVQQLIDSLMYGAALELDGLESGSVVDWLFVLGTIEGSEFFEVKTRLLTKFMGTFTEDSMPVILERLHNLRERSATENGLLSQMMDYTLGGATLMLKRSPALSTNPVIQKHAVQILPRMYQSELTPILLSETSRGETKGIESLFNDSITSDIRILLGEREWHCHCTILSSYSSYFEALFNNSCSFNDLEEGTYRIDCTEFGEELHEVIIKYCYNLFDECVIPDSMAIPLLKCASFYGLTQLVGRSVVAIGINTGNYFELVGQLGHYPCEALCTRLVEFGFANIKLLGMSEEKLASLPEQIKEKLSWRCIQEQVRK